ncbi:DUF1413 domain-containing protein [Desulfitobacterium sp. THU1]|uniref:DUF1413 domain-containing protein n=1 Tax=Desulfitobacterium sp. THU1 TaxID=3138072 RepID=UPI00311E877A
MHDFDPLEHIMGVDEASEMWGLSPTYIKKLCYEQKLMAKKISNTWILSKFQSNPSALSVKAIEPSALLSPIIKALPSGTTFELNELVIPGNWKSLSLSEKRSVGKMFHKEVLSGDWENIEYVGRRPNNHAEYRIKKTTE